MANIADLQKSMKSLLEKAQAIQTAAGDNPMTEDQLKEFKGLLAQAEPIKDQIDAADKAAALEKWSHESDGNSAVRREYGLGDGTFAASFTRPDLDGAGDIAGVGASDVTVSEGARGHKSASGGDLYAINGAGEAKVKALKSGAYKDAINEYVRGAGLGRGVKSASMKVLQEGVDESGGFWVPPDIRSEIVRKIAVSATIRPNAYAFTTGSDIASFPKVSYTTDNLYSSGVRLAWVAENLASNMAEGANPVAGRVQIPVNIATAVLYLTRQQLEDNQFDILGYISQELAMAYALGEENVFTSGDGVAKPQGILTHPNATVANASGGMAILSGTAGGLNWGLSNTAGTATTGVIGVEAALPPQYEQNAKWFGNKTTYAALRALTDTAQRPLWQAGDAWPNMNNGYQPTLLGYGTLKNMFMPAIGAANYPLGLGDLQGYFIADRVGLSIEVLREVAALRDMVVIYARKRVGGQLVKDWMVKLMKSNNS